VGEGEGCGGGEREPGDALVVTQVMLFAETGGLFSSRFMDVNADKVDRFVVR
jgi:hypothetical protein